MITILIVSIVLILPKKSSVLIVPSPSPSVTPTAPPVPKGEWGSIDVLIKDIGKPISQEDTATKSGQYKYNSSTLNRKNEVVYQDNVPVFYKEIVTNGSNKTSKSIQQKYGSAEIRLYGSESDIGFYLYAYPSKGIAYVGSIYDDIVTEVWYFSPTDLNSFMATWAKDYSLQPQQGGF